MKIDSDFRRSSLCPPIGGCVEVKRGIRVLVRDSKDPDGLTLDFSLEEWGAFIEDAKAGKFDL